MRVLSLESRRAKEIETLLRAQGWEPFVAPALREIPIEENRDAFAFGERLLAGGFDLMVCLTGAGMRYLMRVLTTRYDETAIKDALRKLTVLVRGPKPAAALREMGIEPNLIARDPSTWREVLALLTGRPERRAAVQEYGRRDEHLLAGMRNLGIEVTPVPVYQWALPLDTGPLREAIRRLISGEFDCAIFTSAVQYEHLMRIAVEEGSLRAVRDALSRILVASIGPTTSAALAADGLEPGFIPTEPKMGRMIHELARQLQGGSLPQRTT